ncbi:MAG: alanine racemase [Candidatus Hydrogenedentes bacterium]|nr:alanine racemase [Candidatus Hydrogenedentota bacterium]
MNNTIHTSQAIVDLAAYEHNLSVVRSLIGPKCGIMAVVKADAYGLGAVAVARRALKFGAAMLGVATVNEGIELRESDIDVPILLLMQADHDALAPVIKHNLTLMLSDVKTAEVLGDMARKANTVVPVHCMVDTGMGRQGFAIETAAEDIQYLTRISHIDIEGIATHFPVASRANDDFTYGQIKVFKHLLKRLEKDGTPFEMSHAANSAATVNYPGGTLNLVRVGIMTFGVWPTDQPPAAALLRPVLRWETRVAQVRNLESGSSVGYGRTYTAPTRMKAAMLPVGYADGYPRSLSNKAEVLIRGVRCPVRGSVCMDQMVVDVTNLPRVEAGDTAVLLGSDGEECITAAELACHADTIPYEILTGIGKRVPRVYEV